MSELALKLIAENKAKHARGEDARVLDLGNCGLAEVPEEVGDLVWLEELILSGEWWSYSLEIQKWKRRHTNNKGNSNKITFLPSTFPNLWLLKKLVISKSQIIDLSPIETLINLQELSCSSTLVANLSPLAKLINLEQLFCYNTPVSDLSPLTALVNLHLLYCDNTQISNLSPLRQLTKIRSFFCFNSHIADLEPLSKLLNLQLLYCDNTKVSNLSPLATVVNLQEFSCNNTLVSDLSPLAALVNLQFLSCDNTQINSLSPLEPLVNLQEFSCENTHVSDLSPLSELIKKGIAVKWKTLDGSNGIFIKDCPIQNPPKEIVDQGTSAILQYFAERSKLQFKNTEVKLILIGNSTSGKTSLSQYLQHRTYTQGQPTTHGILNQPWQPEGRDLQVNLWDFGGQEYYHATHRLFLSRNAVYALVWDAQTEQGGFCETTVHFDNDPEPSTLQLEHFPQKWWLQNIRHYTRESNPPVPILIVQNKTERDQEGEVSSDFGKPPFHLNPADRNNYIDLAAAGDPKHPKHQKWLRQFEIFEERLLDKLQSQLAHYEFAVYHRDIRDKVRQLATEGITDMSYHDFEKLCRDIEADASMDLVQIYLRDITGDILYYPHNERLREQVFLRPGWVCNQIYAILSRKVLEKQGLFAVEWVRKRVGVASSDGVTLSHPVTTTAEDFVELMREFELVFSESDDDGNPTGQLVAPQYLPDECSNPAYLQGLKDDIILTHAFTLWFPEFLPKSHIARFIANWGEKAVGRVFWKNGLLFKTEDCKALVERIDDNKIRVALQANQPKRRAAMQRIFQSFLKLEDGQTGFAVSLNDVPSVGVTLSHADTTSQFVWWHDVQEAIQTQARQVKTYPPKTSKLIDIQPFTIFQQPPKSMKKVFISYSHNDEAAMKELDKFLGPLERKGEITIWTDRKILPGQNWKDEIMHELENADLTLLLVSANFLDSDFINNEEIPRAFQRMNDHGKPVIPIILNHCLWDMTDLSTLQATPKDGRPIADFPNPAQAWSEVARGIVAALKG